LYGLSLQNTVIDGVPVVIITPPEIKAGKEDALAIGIHGVHGALPTLRAATAMDAVPGTYHAPDRMFGLKGHPVLIPIPKPARDQKAARRLWETSEDFTRVQWPVELQTGVAAG
jgi:hypothetical protein